MLTYSPMHLFAESDPIVFERAQQQADDNGCPVAVLARGGWLAICEEPPDEAPGYPLENGWRLVTIVANSHERS